MPSPDAARPHRPCGRLPGSPTTRAGRHSSRLAVGAILLPLLLSPGAPTALAQPAPVARAVSVQGIVEARRAGETAWQPVKLNDTFAPGDAIRLGERSRADLAMLDQSVLRLNAKTEIAVEAVKEEHTGVVELLRGAANFLSRGRRSLEVRTPFTIAGVRGTEFFASVEPDRTLLTVFEGTVVAENPAGTLSLASGQSAVAEAGKPPVIRVVVRPRDAVHWALYYPPVLYFPPDAFPAEPDWRGMARRSLGHYRTGDLRKAFDAIAAAPPSVADPRFLAYRAHLLLAVGRADEAALDIERALQLAPGDVDALALRTIVGVVQGDADAALDLARKAVQLAPDSATAQVALSYAQQSRFDLEGARASLQRAVQLDPRNALAWARLSELWASFGDLGRALRAAERAAALEPNLSRTQTVLGYAYLMRTRTKLARAAFEKAIALDSADPLPRLGLGLAKIRESDLHGGSREVEIGASLDPSNALVRSYLGKAYYEEKRSGLDGREYAVAKQLDPNDPTPWFYDAITKQTTNRPVEALRDLQRAIELNDNRAVYRSRLLLDSDLAARSASLARIYSDLGFQQLALVEGWKSVNTDPTNFSSHRFLADSYAALPRHEIARVSELLQSQLLQPLNVTPIQPRLAESNLLLISAGGPGALSFNEFNPIFNRDRLTLQVTGLGGENDTWAGEGVLAGIYRQVSASLGYSHFETDGWRTNANQTDRIANAFAQLELSPYTSVQVEYRHRRIENGDLELNFFADDFRPNFRQEAEFATYRAGLRQAFSPGSILLGSFTYQHRDSGLRDRFASPPATVTLDQETPDQRALSGEVQYLFRSPHVNVIAGGGYFDVDIETTQTLRLDFPPIIIPPLPPIIIPPIIQTTQIDQDVRHTNLYLYSDLHLLRGVAFTVGASADLFDTDSASSEDRNQVNPKLGVTWTPAPATTIRAAAFRVLKRTLITDQTLEPTQVAGFNQFFDDVNATASWRYGAAVDQKLGRDLFAGAEVSRRELEVPVTAVVGGTTEVRRSDGKEHLGRAYLFWTPHPWLALSAEYQYERLTRDDDLALALGSREVTTHRLPLGLRFFHPFGWTASLKGTYVDQAGEFMRRGAAAFEAGETDFWVVDAAVGYRLPRRYGIVTVGATNLFDEKFRFQETDLRNLSIQPDRMFFTRVTIALP
jgi:tetratricopeptide (TPR) repeat protein